MAINYAELVTKWNGRRGDSLIPHPGMLRCILDTDNLVRAYLEHVPPSSRTEFSNGIDEIVGSTLDLLMYGGVALINKPEVVIFGRDQNGNMTYDGGVIDTSIWHRWNPTTGYLVQFTKGSYDKRFPAHNFIQEITTGGEKILLLRPALDIISIGMSADEVPVPVSVLYEGSKLNTAISGFWKYPDIYQAFINRTNRLLRKFPGGEKVHAGFLLQSMIRDAWEIRNSKYTNSTALIRGFVEA